MIYMLCILFYLFMLLLFGSWSGRNGIFANMLLLIMGFGVLFLMNTIGTIILIVPIVIMLWLWCYSGSDKSKKKDEIKLSNNSIKFKDDLY